MIKTVSTLTAAAVLLAFTSVFAQTPAPAPAVNEPAPSAEAPKVDEKKDKAVNEPAPSAEAPKADENKGKKGKAKGHNKHGKAKAKGKE
jgi:hypothetical protein